MKDTAALLKSINRLEDLEAIKNLKHAYLRCMTSSLRDELRDLLTEDVVTSYSDGKYVFDSRDALLEFLIDSNSQATATVAYSIAACSSRVRILVLKLMLIAVAPWSTAK